MDGLVVVAGEVGLLSGALGGGADSWGGGGDALSGGSVVDVDRAVWLSSCGEVGLLEVLVVGEAEQSEDFDIGEALIDEPFVDVVDLAEPGGDGAVGVDAVSVAGHDRKLLNRGGFVVGAAEFEDFALHVLERVVQVVARQVEQ